MAASFYFYDVETSGRIARSERIMQFAGQRTDTNFKPIGEPDNFLIKLSSDILPEPDAILTHGITPQQANADGITEAEFLKYFDKQIATANTTFVGFNNIRFDDEFMRFTLWRNFYDSYEWQWKDGSGRWDIQDVVRMTRALRPEGIEWPKADAQNRLPILAKLNKLEHTNAHDALSDVSVLIELTKLLQTKQPKIFDYLLNLRSKDKLEPFVKSGQPFVYTSGRYPKEKLHTTVVATVANHPQKSSVFVYDLQIDPEPFLNLSVSELVELWKYKHWKTEADRPAYFPVKELAFNKCPAVAPISVLDDSSQKRLALNMDQIKANLKKLQAAEGFGQKLVEASSQLYPESKTGLQASELSVDGQLYDGFVNNADRIKMRAVRAGKPNELADLINDFSDERLKLLVPLYKARNYPTSLDPQEQTQWEAFCKHKLLDGGQQSQTAKFFNRLSELENQPKLTKQQKYLLEELRLYGQSILPSTYGQEE